MVRVHLLEISDVEREVEELYEGVLFANKTLTGIPYLLSVEMGILDFFREILFIIPLERI